MIQCFVDEQSNSHIPAFMHDLYMIRLWLITDGSSDFGDDSKKF